MVFGFRRRPAGPAALLGALPPEDRLLGHAPLQDGGWLAASRFGVWRVPAEGEPWLIPWTVISRVRWQSPVLELTVADVVGEFAGAELIVDRTPVAIEFAETTRLTDQIHSRVRAGIISGEHHPLREGGGWVVVRRVPGRDGALVQVRLDPGTDRADAERALAGQVAEAMQRAGQAPR